VCYNCFACIIHSLALDLWLAKARRPPAPLIVKKNILKNTVRPRVFVSAPVQSDAVYFPVMENCSDV